ncbi:hypothetical protein ACFQI7_15275 [Paenibacillus allorhizosphaerae]|uniref:Uncharacterized protein n=1 Tax=Paenibacillus allorhizosphaerae TaxID=2849866 RepID=A0ABM8VDM5_9BACL|nr:hypothetical protein [Paenibacillus allorhizosphaerae]CAG7628237.1 hypothetical protein PAECIP111802_01436 [Paenibacillus allorhizosphaerae]
MKTNPFTVFEQAVSEQDLEQFRQSIIEEGFSGFRKLLEGFRDRLKRFDETEAESTSALLACAKKLFPAPVQFSPSWAKVWDEFERIIGYKIMVLDAVQAEERDGEWQILIDNPFTNTDIVCYPSLSFIEGAYMYAYFRTDLKQNEYIRLQKIQNVIMAFGSEGAVITEKSKDQ